jgi:hypothetical protein
MIFVAFPNVVGSAQNVSVVILDFFTDRSAVGNRLVLFPRRFPFEVLDCFDFSTIASADLNDF